MKKFISIGFTALMIISAFVVLDIIPVENVRASGDPVWNGSFWETAGDWVVDASSTIFTYTNTTIIVNGDLTIRDMFTLTLQNVTLLMNCTSNGAFNIIVQSGPFSGGALIIEDLDGDPLTTEDASNITSYTPDGSHRFGFIVEGINGGIQMRNSELHECGWDLTPPDFQDGGLWIGGYATIENNDISDCYVGIIIYGADDPIIKGNNIHDCPIASGIMVVDTGSSFTTTNIGPDNIVTNCFWGIFIRSCTNINIHNNTLYSNGNLGISGGLSVDNGGASTSSEIWIQDNNITANEEYSFNILGAPGDEVKDVYVLRNEINGSTNQTHIEYVDGLEIRNNYICQGGPDPTLTYFLAWEVTNGIFDNNVVSDNVGIGALFNSCGVNITNNSFENNPAGGFGVQYGSSGLIENNKVINNKDMGAHIVGTNLIIRNNEFRNNGDGTPYNLLPIFQDCGLDLMNSNNIYIYNNQFIQNVKSTGPDNVDGIYLLGSDNVYMENNTMDQNDNNLHVRGDTYAWDNNSTYTKSSSIGSYDVYIEDAYLEDSEPIPYGPSHITFLNTTFDNSSVYIADSISGDFTCQWYKNVKTIDFGGSPISLASVWINDSNGNPEPSSGQPFTTDLSGWVRLVPLTEYVQDYSGETFYTPHTIEAIESSRGAFDQAFMWHTHDNILSLDERPMALALRTEFGPKGSVYRTNTIIIEAEGEDIEDSDDILITPHFEYRVNATSSWIDESSSYFGIKIYTPTTPGEGVWEIEFTPPTTAPIDTYGFRVRFNDTNPSFSDWRVVDNMVDVLNNHPNAEDILVLIAPPEVYRGQNIDIYADASDIEDIDEDSTWYAELEYRLNGSATWESVHITVSGYDSVSGDWKFVFSPPGTRPDPNNGSVDFRVRFQDPDGNWSSWYQEDDLVNILNNPPQFVDFGKEKNNVYRGNTVRVYVNVSDVEELEQDLYVHFYYYNGANWVDDWLSTPIIGPGGQGEWDPVQQRFFVEFTPPFTANTSYYEFRLYISDSDGGYLTYVPGSNIIEVMNNPPIALYPVSASAPQVRAGGGYVYIYVNGTDFENAEDLLTLTVQQRFNETGNPPDIWYDTYITTETYEGTPPTGRLRANFTPLSGAQLGFYDFRAWVEDEDGDISNYIYLFNAVEVLNPEPVLEDITLGALEIYRTNTLYIFLNASDIVDNEWELTPEVQYKAPNGSWTDIQFAQMSYDSVGGYWIISFIPDLNAELGDYEFRGRVKNTAQGYSNGGTWTPTANTAEVKNNLPLASNLRIEGANTVEKGDEIFVYAEGTDIETDSNDLIPHFEYRAEGGSWENLYLTNLRAPIGASNTWRITFSPPNEPTFPLGFYDFRVWFEDEEGDLSNTIEISDMIEVLVRELRVDDINVPFSGYRTQTIYVTANGTNPSGSEAELVPEFEYKGPTGDWISLVDPSSYLTGSPQYTNGYWQIGFNAPKGAELGLYSFRIRFSNIMNTSDWMTSLDSFTLMNNVPTVSYIFIPSSGYRLEPIIITSNGIDIDGNSEDLTPIFQYRGPTGDWVGVGEIGSYFQNPAEYVDGSWRIEFNASANAELGQYSFKVQFSDDYDTGEWLSKLDSFTLMNIAPEVEDLNAPSSGYRLETIYVTANGSDVDGSEHALTPNFQYMGPSDAKWISQGDTGSYLTVTPQYVSGYWRIEFSPSADADLGLYSFRVQFSDGIHTSQWTTLLNSFTLMNNLPTVQITTPSQGVQTTSNITFLSLFSDFEDSVLTIEWDFGDGSPISNEELPNHNYTMNRTYIVTVTVQDLDGGTAEDSITIIIPKEVLPEEPGPEDEGPGFDPMLFLLILFPIIVALLILILFLAMRKKKEEPPTIPPEEITSMETPEETPKEPTGIAETPTPPPPPPPPEDVSEPPIQEVVQEEITPSNESTETPKSEPQEEIEN